MKDNPAIELDLTGIVIDTASGDELGFIYEDEFQFSRNGGSYAKTRWVACRMDGKRVGKSHAHRMDAAKSLLPEGTA